jgi:hypothetical protein
MSTDEGIDDAQSKTGATGGGVAPRRITTPETVENSVLVFARYAGTFVGDRDLGPRSVSVDTDERWGSGRSMSTDIGQQIVDRLP